MELKFILKHNIFFYISEVPSWTRFWSIPLEFCTTSFQGPVY